MVVGMALQIDQQPVARPLCRIPRMARHQMLIFTLAKVLSRQAVMLDIVDQFELKNGHNRLNQKQK